MPYLIVEVQSKLTVTLKLTVPQSGNLISLLKRRMVSTIPVAFLLIAVSEFKPHSQEKPQTQQS